MKKVLILGAGPAGLMAAYRLLQEKEYQVIILENQSKIGGLCQTNDFQDMKLDYGVHFYRMSEYSKINDIIYQLIPIEDTSFSHLTKEEQKKYVVKGKTSKKEDQVMLVNRSFSHIYFNHKFYEYPIKLNFKTLKQIGFIQLILIGISYIDALLFKRKEINLENYYINRYGKKFYEMFFHDYTYKICGVDPKDIHIDWGKQRIRETSLINILKEKIFHKKINHEPSLIQEYYYPKYGCEQVYQMLEQEIKKMGGQILTNSNVESIELKNNQITKVIYRKEKTKKTIQPDYLISSIPIKDFVSLLSPQILKTDVLKDIQTLPFRDLILVNLVFSKKEIEKLNVYQTIKDDSWVFIQDPNISFGRIKIANNWSKYMLGKNTNKVVLTLEYCCNSNDHFSKLNESKMLEIVKKELKILKLYPHGGIEDYKIDRVKNAYPAYYGSYNNRNKMIQNLNTLKNCYFIGRSGQHQYIDMDKAMYTGLVASEHIISNQKDKGNIWL